LYVAQVRSGEERGQRKVDDVARAEERGRRNLVSGEGRRI